MSNLSSPQVVHLGKKSRKEIRKYKRGIGSMHYEVQHVIAQTQAQVGDDKQVLPVVVVHRRRKRKKLRRRRNSWGGGGMGMW